MKKIILLFMYILLCSVPGFSADYDLVMSSRFNPLENEIVEIVEDNKFYTGTYTKGIPADGGRVDINYKIRKADMFGDAQVWLESNGSEVQFTLSEYQDYLTVIFNKVTFSVKRR